MRLENTPSDFPWHSKPREVVLETLGATTKGLDSEGAAERLAQVGPNTLTVKKGTSLAETVLNQLRHPLIYLLGAAALISILAGHAVDATVIGGVVILNTILGTVQERKAGRAMDALRKMAAPHARVLREGKPATVPAAEVVPGDLLLLETGDRIAADARVLENTDLRVDESALTGESEPVSKQAEILAEDSPMADRQNMVWMSTAVTAGRGQAVVTATGMNTSLGNIAGGVQEEGDEETPLQKRLARLSTLLGIGGLTLSGIVFLLGLLRGYDWLEMIFYAMAAAVSAIPEGLPAVISVTLALGVQRMTRRNAIIRSLPAVETLGSTTVICSDKTGTITRNQMTVTRLWTFDAAYTVTGGGFDATGDILAQDGASITQSPPDTLRLLLRIGLLNNNARWIVGDDGERQLNGTPTEGALLVAAHKAGMKDEEEQDAWPRTAEIPFSSEYKYMVTLHRSPAGTDAMVYVKGAPDRILSFCSHVMTAQGPVPITDETRETIDTVIQELAGQALRLVAAAYKTQSEQSNSLDREDSEQGLTFAGFWGIVDPARPEVVEAIRATKDAGIRIVMITGDYAATATAIAREIGIASESDEAVTGAQLDTMDEAALTETSRTVHVFARVSPEHKLRILRALKANGEIVAMTGDGVNDAPALKGADIGVAMGKAGTEVAREASDMVLTDDNFATIVHAVEEGRVIFANLQRVVFFLMTTNLGEVLTLSLALMLGLPLPLTAIMILWINLVTDGVCTIPLGVEPKHWDVLKQPPRPPGAGVIDRPILRRMLVLAPVIAIGTVGLFMYELYAGEEAHAQTVAFVTLAAFQWFQGMSARTSKVSVFSVGLFSNLWLWAGILGAVLLQLLVVYTPFGQTLFGVMPLTLVDWVLITGVASSIFIVDEVLKAIGNKKRFSEIRD